jgi:hypothetical protein
LNGPVMEIIGATSSRSISITLSVTPIVVSSSSLPILEGGLEQALGQGRDGSPTRSGAAVRASRIQAFAVRQSRRADLSMWAGVNPMSPAQILVIESALRGADYVVKYLPR